MGRYALIIASWEYEDRRLKRLVAPPQDAEALARVLEDQNIGEFDAVEVLLNRPSHEVNRAIEAFFTERKRDDLALLYFSGHGIKDGWGRLYFATLDTDYKIPRSTAVRASLVDEVMSDSRARRQVLLLDCCYSGAFGRAKAGVSAGVQEQVGGKGRVVLTSSNALQYSFEGEEVEGEGVHSIFTHVLVRGLETGEADLDADGLVSLDELYKYIYERVIAEKEQQRPQMFATLEGKILVARNPRWEPKPAELPAELRQAIENPLAYVRVGAVRELERLLRGSDAGLALAARQALEGMTEDDSRTVSATAARSLAAYTRSEQEAQAARERERKERERLAAREKAEQERLAREKAERERLAAQKAATERAAREEEQKQLPPAREPATRPQRGPVPAWVWAVIGVAAVGLFIAWGSSAGWGTTVEPTLTPTAEPPPTVGDTTTRWGTTVEPTLTPTAEPPPTVGDTTTRSSDGMVMVHVPGGTFQMGSSDAEIDAAFAQCEQDWGSGNCERSWFEDESPQHAVTLDDFWIDRTEVTNAQYALCVADGVCDRSSYADDEDYNGDDQPVVGVSWYDADAYCKWAGAQLPTEAQWEYAARGEQGYIYPWGNDAPTCERAQFGSCSGRTIPVGTLLDGASWCGALDMAGNVWEWTEDRYGAYPAEAQTNPTGPADGYSMCCAAAVGSAIRSTSARRTATTTVPPTITSTLDFVVSVLRQDGEFLGCWVLDF